MPIRVTLFIVTLATLFAAGCRDCGGPLGSQAAGSIVPAVFEFGPLTLGQKCVANLKVKNDGTEDLSVSKAGLENTSGNFVLQKAPVLVRLGGEEDLLVSYQVGTTVGKVESTGIKLTTDDSKDNGILRASITAIIASAAAPTAKSECGADPAHLATPCKSLDFGATQVNASGVALGVTIINDGTADLHLTPGGAVLKNETGDTEFVVDSVTLGTTVVTDFQQNGATIPPTRSADCGKPTGSNVDATVTVHFTPTRLGAGVDTLVILTDAINSDGVTGGEIDVPLSGVGSDTGILMNPDTLNFGALGEGQTKTIDVLVSNFGTANASVNESCISLNNDGHCDAGCTGDAADSALNGTLSCTVNKSDGTHEGVGFLLGPTDAQAGGDDERHILVTWAPIAGTTSIPGTAVLELQSNILGNKVFTAPIIGGSIGVLEFSTTDGVCTDGSGGLCIPTTGTACTCGTDCTQTQTSTWTGSATAKFKNTGVATVNVSSVALDCPGGATIADDYTLGAISSSAIAPNATATVTVTYANNDASCVDPCNIKVVHDGAGGLTTVPMDIVPPT